MDTATVLAKCSFAIWRTAEGMLILAATADGFGDLKVTKKERLMNNFKHDEPPGIVR
ncbi:hypothetical protein [Lacunimicrobium album]